MGRHTFTQKFLPLALAAASGVMLDSSLSVKKTVTATGVKAPTITGDSSGGSGGTASTPKIAINGLKNPIGEIQVNVGDLKDERDERYLYWDANLPRPQLAPGDAVRVTVHGNDLVSLEKC